VLALRGEGLMNIEIAEQLNILPSTVHRAVYEMRKRGIDVPRSPYLVARREQNRRGFGPPHIVGATKS